MNGNSGFVSASSGALKTRPVIRQSCGRKAIAVFPYFRLFFSFFSSLLSNTNLYMQRPYFNPAYEKQQPLNLSKLRFGVTSQGVKSKYINLNSSVKRIVLSETLL